MTDDKHGTRRVVLLIIFIVVTGVGVLFYTVGPLLALIAIQQPGRCNATSDGQLGESHRLQFRVQCDV